MNNRERIIRSLQHKESDIVPYSVTLTSDACAMMASYYGDPGWIESTFAGKAGNHLSFVSRAPVPELSGWLDKDLYRDEFGLDIFNPFQPEVMDVFEVKRQYGDRLMFYGGVSLQRTLAFGTPDDVRQEVLDLIKHIGSGGGYIVNACHAITRDVPAENIDSLIRTVRDQ